MSAFLSLSFQKGLISDVVLVGNLKEEEYYLAQIGS